MVQHIPDSENLSTIVAFITSAVTWFTLSRAKCSLACGEKPVLRWTNIPELKTVFRMFPIGWNTMLKHRLTAFALILLFVVNRTDSLCTKHAVLLMCRYTFPDAKMLGEIGMGTDMILIGYHGPLEIPKSASAGKYSMKSIQIQQSHITYMAEHFFARFSSGDLTRLTLNNVNGTFQLDKYALGELEDTLVNLRVTEHPVGDISYLSNLKKLERLQLTRTGLTSLPDNFEEVLGHISVLDLTGNELTTLPWDVIAERLEIEKLYSVRLNANKWHCDCRMRPLVEASPAAKDKVAGLQCAEPPHLADYNLLTLRAGHICSAEELVVEAPVVVQAEMPVVENAPVDRVQGVLTGSGDVGPAERSEPLDAPPQVATAGSGLSTEIIAVIVAVILVAVVVIIVVIIFKVRSSNQRSGQHATPKHPTHKNNPYCHVIEHSSSKPTGNSRPSGTTAAGPVPAGHYGRELDQAERQPLAPPYHAQMDNRL
ncbi:unnamed protein product [Dicrocoelium dendriticum]|nr:unnamed protein product [Dicrocoelium dendriticum]